MKQFRMVLAIAIVGLTTVAIGAAPITKRPTTARIVPTTPTSPSAGSDVVSESPKQTDNTAGEDIIPATEPTLIESAQSEATPSVAGGNPVNMDWYSINNGGAIEVAAGNIKMGLSIGQNAVGEVSAGNIKMGLGFWYGASGSGAPSCDCDCHGDPQCDSVTNIFDVTHAVNVAFRGGAAIPDPNGLCLLQTTDVDCNGVTNIFDVTRFVNVAFRGGDRTQEFCTPCVSVL